MSESGTRLLHPLDHVAIEQLSSGISGVVQSFFDSLSRFHKATLTLGFGSFLDAL